MPTISRSTALLLSLLSSAVIVAVAGCAGGEPVDPPTPEAPKRPAAPAPPAGVFSEPHAPKAARAADTPLPARPAFTPEAPGVGDAASFPRSRPPSRPRPPGFGPDYHHTQVVTAVGQMRDTMAPWRDTGGNRLFSTHVFGTPFMLNEEGQPLPWIATAITSNEEMTVWTMKLREDAVFQDGTPITATDFKAYWEHGAKPENIVAWGGASNTLFNIKGWDELRAGDVTQAEGLRVIDDQTLEIEMYRPRPAWHLYMAAWHVGISKLDQGEVGRTLGQRAHRSRSLQPYLRPRQRSDRADTGRCGRQALERPARYADHREADDADHSGRAVPDGHVRERRAAFDEDRR